MIGATLLTFGLAAMVLATLQPLLTENRNK